MRPFTFCNKCKKKMLCGYRHYCSFNNDNEIAYNLRQPDETEEVDINPHETTGQHAENSEYKNRNACNAAPRRGNRSQASTSSAPSSIENKKLDGGSFEEPADSADRPFAQGASFPAPDRKRKLDAGADQPLDLRKVADAVPGPSTICHQTIGPDGKRLFVCDECTYRCKKKSHFDVHYRKHTGEKNHACDFCGKSFAQKGDLNKHARTHTGEKPYVCEKCGKVFSLKGNLNKHLKTHTGETPYSCDICGKGFSERAYLERHLRIHSGERPFACPVCNRRFTQQSNLRRHVATRCRRLYRCRQCQQTFGCNEDRNRHFLQEHQQRE